MMNMEAVHMGAMAFGASFVAMSLLMRQAPMKAAERSAVVGALVGAYYQFK